MSRLLGPKHKMCRRLGVKVCDSLKCPMMRRNYPPGVHGPKGRRRLTAYGEQFREKQRARYTYGVTERQFLNYYQHAVRQTGDTGVHLARRLEMRLDNVVYRLRWAQTRPQARQLVNHGFITVNQQRIDVPSYQVRTKDVIEIAPSKRNKKFFPAGSPKGGKTDLPTWLHLGPEEMTAKIISQPDADQLKSLFDTQAVVELYSR